jgi:uncharacterized OsmC-like protein
MKDLINKLELRITEAFNYQNILESRGEEYDEDCICEVKSEFIRRYKNRLTEDQIDYITKI